MTSIKLTNVCLDYLVKTGSDSIKQTLVHISKFLFKNNKADAKSIRNSMFRALNNINLDLRSGDRLGLIGRNGAGKSTLLRVIAKIYKPHIGSVGVDGRLTNLFDVSLGLNLEANGYENIVNLGIMRGLSKRAARGLIEDIETFTELKDFLKYPVRTYSSGMQMKLSFAVATAIPSEIVLIDEVIGVGDAHFMGKATERISRMIDNTHILVLTSHSDEIIRRFCNKALVLDHGEIQFSGDTESSIRFYNSMPVS